MTTDPHYIALSDEQLSWLNELAGRTGKSPEELLSEALRHFHATTAGVRRSPKSLYDRLAEKGLVGCLDGGPADLSTNPKHMEGFGTSDH